MKLGILILSLISSFTFAATEDGQLSTTLDTNSTFYRKDKNFSITGELVGVGPSTVYGQGINFGFFLSDKSLLTIELNGGKNDNNEGFIFTWGDRIYKEGYSIGVHYKHFVGNSFYFKGGMDYRTLEFKYVNDYWFSDEEATRSFKGESTALGIALGNQWQFGNFTLGCDWFGFQFPLASRIYDEEYSANVENWEVQDNKQDMDRYVREVSYTALRFYLGASF